LWLSWINVLIQYQQISIYHSRSAMPLGKVPPQVIFLPLGAPEEGASLQGWLYESLRNAILGGRLPAGSKLPSTRAMAGHYSLARGTVQAAYLQLLSEGYLQARTGSGTRGREVWPDPTLNAGYVRRRAAADAGEKHTA